MITRPPPRVSPEAILAFGTLFEPLGLPPVAGRMVGALLLEGRELSLDELADATGASKASVSQNGRMLVRGGWIEPAPKLGARKDYYRATGDSGTRPMEELLVHLRRFADVYRDACDRGLARNAGARNHLRLCASLFDHMATSLEAQLSEWRARVSA